MPFDLLICDCDGVLVDSEVLACRIDAEELARRGFAGYPLDEVLRRFAGVSQSDMITIIEGETGRSLGTNFSATVASRVEQALREELSALPGAGAVLASLAMAKCVASSSAPLKLDLALTVTGLKEYFAPHIFSSVLVERGKPAPDLFLYAARQFGASPERCCVIEDSIAGVTAARAAGMSVIGFVGGSHCYDDHASRLLDQGASAVAQDWDQIPGLLPALVSDEVRLRAMERKPPEMQRAKERGQA
jgi:HAD superfamily hydrolase (TIGR01509 family)